MDSESDPSQIRTPFVGQDPLPPTPVGCQTLPDPLVDEMLPTSLSNALATIFNRSRSPGLPSRPILGTLPPDQQSTCAYYSVPRKDGISTVPWLGKYRGDRIGSCRMIGKFIEYQVRSRELRLLEYAHLSLVPKQESPRCGWNILSSLRENGAGCPPKLRANRATGKRKHLLQATNTWLTKSPSKASGAA